MRWFLALNARAFQADRYSDLLKVAVQHTALKHTSLVPHVLYDGQNESVSAWLRARGVRIISCRTSAYDALDAIAERRDPNLLSIGAGALLRLELPRIVFEQGMDDEFVLYTDVDVMFMHDVCPFLSTLQPKYFSVGPEFDRDDSVRMNSGVMLMNIAGLRTIDSDFRRFVGDHLAELVDDNWDQGAYRRYFRRSAILTLATGTRWDALPPEFNWKPYWGPNDRAAIVHFHGPKPQDREILRSAIVPDHMKWMIPSTHNPHATLVSPGICWRHRRMAADHQRRSPASRDVADS